MEPIVQKATTILTVDGEQAKNEIDDINVKLKDLDKALKKADKENDHALHKSLTSQKNKLLANRTALQKHIVDVNKVLNNLSVSKPKELSATIVALKKQLNDPSIKRGSDGWKLISEKINLCKKELASVNSELQIGQSGWNKSTASISKYVGFAATAIASITGITVAFSRLKDERDKLESSAAGVKALTGLGDEDVAWLTGQAKKLSTSVTDEGVRIEQTATEISDSFGIIGSQRPELLKNAEALKQVTQDAIYLSIAGKDQLEPSAKALTTVMNQMNLGAEDSRRIINAIAAGSQAGAGDIRYITEAFEKSGTTANMMNISLEQQIGLIETIAPKYSEAAVAGTSLDRVLLIMQKNNIGYKDGVFDLGRAIDDINDRFSKGEKATALFGPEHAKMATILANSRSEVERYTLAVTGTNKAVEQANINSGVSEVKQQQARNELTLLGIELIEKLNPAITSTMNLTVSWTRHIMFLLNWIGKNSAEIAICSGAIAIHTLKMNTSVLSDKAKVIWTGHVCKAISKLYLLIRNNPWTFWATAALVAATAVYKFMTSTSEAEKAAKNFRKELEKEKLEAGLLFDALKKTNEGTDDRKRLIQTINEKYGQYLTNQLTEKSNWEDINTALKQVNSSLETQIAMRIKSNASSAITETYINDVTDKYDYIRKTVAEQSSEDIAKMYVSDLRALMQAGGKTSYEIQAELGKKHGNVLTSSAYRDLMRIRKIADEYKQDMADLDEKFSFINSPSPAPATGDSGGTGGSDNAEIKSKKSLIKIQQELREEKEKLPESTEAELDLKHREIEAIDTEITRLKELGTTKKKEGKSKNNKESEKLKKEFEQTLKLNDEYHSAFKNQEKKRYLDQEINSAVYNKHIEMLELASLNNRIELMRQFNEKLKPEHEKLRANIEQEQEKLLDKRIAFLKKWGKKVSVSDYIGKEDQEEEKEDPEMDKLIERTKRSYEYRQAELKNQYEKNEITQLEYQQRERDLQQEHMEGMLSSRIAFADQVSQIAQQAAQLVNTLSQREELAVDNKYAAQLKAAKGNAEKTAAIEEQMEEEKKAIKKKYADIDFAITAAQIIANTAGGIMKLWAEMGIAALPLQFLVGATGLAQLLLANEQRQQVKNLWTGGYTSPGRWDEPQGVVHSDEFVGNRFAVRNKAVNRVFKMIDLAQKNNTIASINETDIIRSLGAVRSGSSEKEIVYRNTPSGVDPRVTEALVLVSRSVSDLKRQMEEGTLARTYVTGDGGTKTARDKYDKMLKNVTRYNKKV